MPHLRHGHGRKLFSSLGGAIGSVGRGVRGGAQRHGAPTEFITSPVWDINWLFTYMRANMQDKKRASWALGL
jgi:hypothetical protein